MPYDAKAIANYFLDLAEAKGESLTPMKLQKLVYYAHGWHLALTDRPLLNEVIQAWSFGPVVRTLYNEFREFGSGPITDRAKEFANPASASAEAGRFFKFIITIPSIDDYADEDNEYTKRLLDRIWKVYGKYTAIQLSNMTHAPGTPWDRVNKQYNGAIPKYAVIPDEWIAEYFKKPGTI
jgi:uncharacterized phage-associated protein